MKEMKKKKDFSPVASDRLHITYGDVIAFASQGLQGSESNYQNYSAFKLELQVLKWAAHTFVVLATANECFN